jgi:hypothetical protein
MTKSRALAGLAAVLRGGEKLAVLHAVRVLAGCSVILRRMPDELPMVVRPLQPGQWQPEKHGGGTAWPTAEGEPVWGANMVSLQQMLPDSFGLFVQVGGSPSNGARQWPTDLKVHGMQEVSGSSPLSSTGQKRNPNSSNSEYSRKVPATRTL